MMTSKAPYEHGVVTIGGVKLETRELSYSNGPAGHVVLSGSFSGGTVAGFQASVERARKASEGTYKPEPVVLRFSGEAARALWSFLDPWHCASFCTRSGRRVYGVRDMAGTSLATPGGKLERRRVRSRARAARRAATTYRFTLASIHEEARVEHVQHVQAAIGRALVGDAPCPR